MSQGGNTYEKYERKRRIDGKLCLSSLIHDTACRLLAEETPQADIPKLLDNEITAEEIEQGLKDWQWQRRINWLKKQIERESFEPESPDECLKFVKSRLVGLSKNAEQERSKIEALKALARVAMDERENKPSTAPTPDNPAIKKLNEMSDGSH